MALPVTGQTLASPLHWLSPVQVASFGISVQPVAQSAQSLPVQDESCMFAPEARQATPKPARHRPNSSFFIDLDSVSKAEGRRTATVCLWKYGEGTFSPIGRARARLGLESARLRGETHLARFERRENPLVMREDPLLDDPDDDPDNADVVDLHGLTVERALRRVAQALHTARVRRRPRLLVVTGAGWGNPDQKAVLRPAVEAWLRSPEARELGVKDVQRVHRDGALDVWLR